MNEEKGRLRAVRLGRYVLCDELASGGMATVHLARLAGDWGFSRVVAIKRLHPHFAKDPTFRAAFLDEARIAARIRHRCVVTTLDVVDTDDELFLVMEYVPGESLATAHRMVMRSGKRIPLGIATAILLDTLEGLHVAHEARDERGEPLDVVHRDVSPQNVLVSEDGVARVLDFGIAKAAGQSQHTATGVIKGKVAYMAPEQLRGFPLDRRADVYAAGVILWEVLTGRRCFTAASDLVVAEAVLAGLPGLPSEFVADLPLALDEVVKRACAADPEDRYPTAEAMAAALEAATRPATHREVAAWLSAVTPETLSTRAEKVRDVESQSQPAAPDAALAQPPPADSTVELPNPLAAPRVPSLAEPFTSATIDPAPTPAAGPPRWLTTILAGGALLVAIGTMTVVIATRPVEPPQDSALAAGSAAASATTPPLGAPAAAADAPSASASASEAPTPSASAPRAQASATERHRAAPASTRASGNVPASGTKPRPAPPSAKPDLFDARR
jgi:eukaryotic-like serine/threonine-protein kinase